MTPVATETQVRQAIAALVQTEFAAESVTVFPDRLPRAAGADAAAPVVAASPEGPSEENPRDVTMLTVRVLLQYYMPFRAAPDEHIAVDPGIIEDVARRLRKSAAGQDGANNDFWYFRLRSIDYPPDPTGNMTRLEAHYTAWAFNDAGTP